MSSSSPERSPRSPRSHRCRKAKCGAKGFHGNYSILKFTPEIRNPIFRLELSDQPRETDEGRLRNLWDTIINPLDKEWVRDYGLPTLHRDLLSIGWKGITSKTLRRPALLDAFASSAQIEDKDKGLLLLHEAEAAFGQTNDFIIHAFDYDGVRERDVRSRPAETRNSLVDMLVQRREEFDEFLDESILELYGRKFPWGDKERLEQCLGVARCVRRVVIEVNLNLDPLRPAPVISAVLTNQIISTFPIQHLTIDLGTLDGQIIMNQIDLSDPSNPQPRWQPKEIAQTIKDAIFQNPNLILRRSLRTVNFTFTLRYPPEPFPIALPPQAIQYPGLIITHGLYLYDSMRLVDWLVDSVDRVFGSWGMLKTVSTGYVSASCGFEKMTWAWVLR